MFYDKESDFEDDLVAVLKRHGWTDGVLEYPTEQDLISNWANILFDNNKGIDRLNGQRLTKGEMAQILEQIETLRTPLALNSFINGKTVSIKRDNPKDEAHYGKEISLKIYDRQEIAAGQSRYQIARQPMYPAKNKMLNDRRGDVCLLINGMPVIHIELKKSGIPFWIRIPLIPTVNDTEENMRRTAALLQGAARLERVELLPYHKTAGAKYAAAGMNYDPGFPTGQEPQIHLEPFQEAKIPCVVN